MNFEQALDELTRWQKEAERLQKLLDVNTKASQDAVIVAALAVETERKKGERMQADNDALLRRLEARGKDLDYAIDLIDAARKALEEIDTGLDIGTYHLARGIAQAALAQIPDLKKAT